MDLSIGDRVFYTHSNSVRVPTTVFGWNCRRDRNAPHVTFICAQIACVSILVILMSLSSHLFVSICHMAVSIEDIHLGPQLSLRICNDSMLFLPCARVLPQGWVDFRVVMGKLNCYLALCSRCAETPPLGPLCCFALMFFTLCVCVCPLLMQHVSQGRSGSEKPLY